MTQDVKLMREPGVAFAEAGQVILDGPDGVAVAMTPEAAEETGCRLIVAARAAAQDRLSPSA